MPGSATTPVNVAGEFGMMNPLLLVIFRLPTWGDTFCTVTGTVPTPVPPSSSVLVTVMVNVSFAGSLMYWCVNGLPLASTSAWTVLPLGPSVMPVVCVPSPQLITTFCVSVRPGSVTVPTSVVVPASTIGDVALTLTVGATLFTVIDAGKLVAVPPSLARTDAVIV